MSCRPWISSSSSDSSTTPAGCNSSSTRRTAAASTAPSDSRCARSSAARSTSSCRPPRVTTRSCSRSARTTRFPLDEVVRYVKSHSVEETLIQAFLDAPMFISRWRWNLNRALLVLRFRGGRKNPPPIQRMEADDLMAAVFPQAAACQDNRVGPVEIPDHVIVRQTISDTLHEALDVDGLRALLERIESGAVRVHTVDSTEPSVLAHEILTSKPYTFLDDEEFQNRRTNAVNIRRGLTVDLETIGRLDPDAVRAVHAEITPQPESSDDLHDLLCSVVTMPPRLEWTDMWAQLVDTGRGRFVVRAGRKLWCATEMLDGRATSRRRVTTRRRPRQCAATWSSPASRRARRSRAQPASTAAGSTFALIALQGEGFAIQGAYRRRSPRGAVGVAPAARAHALVLAQVPPRRRRAGDEPGLDAVPAALAAPRTRIAAARRRRARDGHRQAAGLGSRGRRMGARALRPPPARVQPGRARPPVPRRRHRLAAPEPAPARRGRAGGRAQQGDADLGRAARRPRLAARRVARGTRSV